MRLARFCFSLILLLAFNANAVESNKISINVEDAPVAQIFSLLASAKNLNIVVDPKIKQSLTLRLNNVEWQDALDILKDLTRVEITQYANVLVVHEITPLNAEDRGEEPSLLSQHAHWDKGYLA